MIIAHGIGTGVGFEFATPIIGIAATLAAISFVALALLFFKGK